MLTSASDYIIKGIRDIFVPSEDFLTEKVDHIKSKFGIIDSVSSTIGIFTDFFDTVAEGKPPKIEIHLDNAETDIYYGDVAYALDMTWYERYKPTVDIVLSSMMWVFFAWRVFTHMPSIISGVGGGAETIAKIGKDK